MAPIGLFSRLKAYYTKDSPKAPALSPRSAAALSVLFTLVYVLPFYLNKATRPSPTLSRDAPSSIRARVRAVTFSCIVSTLITLYTCIQYGQSPLHETLRLLGVWPISVVDIGNTLLLVAILFAGPLFEAGIVDGEWRDWIRLNHVHEVLSSWIGWRNFVAGPISEELIWRALIVPIHLLANISPTKTVFISPLYFGIAHVHHYYEFRLTHPETHILPAILRSLFQFTYTSLFGFFAAFVFLRTGNLPAVILAHSFCNWMGLPRFCGRVGVEAGVPIGPPGVRTKEDSDAPNVQVGDGRLGISWTVAYYVLLVAGAYGFYHFLFPLTESSRALASFGKLKSE